MLQARRRFFAREGFAPDGGYDEVWSDASFGPFPYATYNPPARGAALRVHDLHHVVTGYGTSWRDESRISGWELGSGGAGRYPYAWFIALFGLFVGLLALPVQTWRAFVRGRGSGNLYRADAIEPWLSRDVDEVRATLATRPRPRRGAWRTALAFFGYGLLAVGLGAVFVAGVPMLVALGVVRRVGRCPCRCPLSASAV